MDFISSILTSPTSKEKDQLEEKLEKQKLTIEKMKKWYDLLIDQITNFLKLYMRSSKI